MSEPITEKEINEYREKVRVKLEKQESIKRVVYLVLFFVLFAFYNYFLFKGMGYKVIYLFLFVFFGFFITNKIIK